MSLRVVEEADEEAIEAAVFYDARREGLGREFLEELRRAFNLIEEHPLRFGQLETTDLPVRRILLRRFPYYVVYEVFESETVVWAVAHGAREPGFWKSRRN